MADQEPVADFDLSEFEAKVTKAASDAELISTLEARGFYVLKDAHNERDVALSDQPSGTVRFAVVSDTHLGHKHQQLTHLRNFYGTARDWGAQFMLHGGDLVDGQRMHRDQEFELHRHGVDAQGRYAAEALPVLKSKRGRDLSTYAIGGNHDGSGWNDAGADVLRVIKGERDDFVPLGAPTAMFHWGPLRIMLMHPDGGPSYARSYKLQKIVENFAPDTKPHLLLAGHWHVANHLPGYRNVEAFALPCFQAQTAYLRRKGLAPVIGGLLFEAEYGVTGLHNLTTKWVIYHSTVDRDWP